MSKLPTAEKKAIPWTDDAKELVSRIPKFVQQMVIGAIEDFAQEKRYSQIDSDVVREVEKNMGMEMMEKRAVASENPEIASTSDNLTANLGDIPQASEIILKKIKPFAPNFHKHIVQSKLQGQVGTIGQKILVYKIIEISPSNPSRITDQTIFRFK